ncbi:MAG: Abi family protein [Fibromonadaceae bacterium]|nr:Abi family protein [Fibromonadaceae bacterium]
MERISYYRLGSYWHPFLEDKQNKIFKENVSFDSAFEIYKFDMNLRKIIIAEIEKIEVAFRSKMAHILSLSNGSFWFDEKDLFSKSYEHKSLVLKIKEEIKRSDESLIVAFKKEYSNDIPPTFMLLEITSFGTLSKLYKNLKSSKEKQEIASFFGLLDKAFESWLYSLVYVRNICAHYARLWNRKMRIIPVHPETHKNQWLDNKQIPNNRMYFILSMIVYLLNIINPENKTFCLVWLECFKS